MENMVKRKVCNNSLKHGISLMVLVLTIILSLILISAVVISTQNVIDDSKLTVFAKNLNTIQDTVENYYITNNVIPTLNNSTAISKNELVSMSNSQDLLIQELTENNDLDSTFYKIDLAKINVTKLEYGNGKSGANDIFVISYPSMNVYYPYGLDAKKTTYFSITSKISNVIKVSPNTSDVSVISSSGIKVTKTNNWANKMGVSIEADMAPNELLYMSVSGDPNRLITTTVGKNIFGFDLLSSIVNGTETIKVPSLTLTEANYIEMDIKPLSERYVDILKYNGTELIGKVRIDLSDFSNNLPTITSATLSSTSTLNKINLLLASSESGIKEVRYEYLTKYSDRGTIENYYNNVSNFDSTYMTSKSKRANLNNGMTAIINVPKNVQSIKIAVIDRAGNINLYNQEVATRLYIGYAIDNNTKGSVEANVPESLQLTAKVFSTNGVKTISFSKSLDGINFTDEQVYTLNTTINGTTNKQCMPYTGILQNNAYVKIVAVNYDGTLTETRILNIEMKDVIFQGSTWNNPKIPAGFRKSTVAGETEVDKGLVIIDNTNKNEFVWVPVQDFSKFVRVEYNKGDTVATCTEATWNGVSTVTELDKIYKSVKENGGFYIARYEAGIDTITVPTTSDHKTVQDGTIKPVSKAGRGTWNFVKWGSVNSITDPGLGAVTLARSMYNTSDIASNLIYGVQWDATLEFIKKTNSTYVIDGTGKGNYTGNLLITGSNLAYKFNNIYDMAGNEDEWTMEARGNNYIHRSGFYKDKPLDKPASYRKSDAIGYKNADTSFRCALYLK